MKTTDASITERLDELRTIACKLAKDFTKKGKAGDVADAIIEAMKRK